MAKSQDLAAGVMLLGAILLLGVFGTHMLSTLFAMTRSLLGPGFSANPTRVDDVGRTWHYGFMSGVEAALPVLIGGTLLALLVGLSQVGMMFTLKPLVPQFSRLSPLRGLQQMFSLRSVMRLVMSLSKMAIVLAVAIACVIWDIPKIVSLIGLESAALLAAFASIVWWVAVKVAAVLLILGLLDFFYQRWQTEQDMKMTKEEVKEELKRHEGDPLVKQRRRKVAQQLMMQRLATDVPKADVVVTNPTHVSVALQYDSDTMHAPKLIAKGADLMALRIRQIASAHRVPVVERPPLARAIFAAVEVGQEIPQEYYAAVAEILAYVYRISGRKSA